MNALVTLCGAMGVEIRVALGARYGPFVRITNLPRFRPHNLEELLWLGTALRHGGWRIRGVRWRLEEVRAYWAAYSTAWEDLLLTCERLKIGLDCCLCDQSVALHWFGGTEQVEGKWIEVCARPECDLLAKELVKVGESHVTGRKIPFAGKSP